MKKWSYISDNIKLRGHKKTFANYLENMLILSIAFRNNTKRAVQIGWW